MGLYGKYQEGGNSPLWFCMLSRAEVPWKFSDTKQGTLSHTSKGRVQVALKLLAFPPASACFIHWLQHRCLYHTIWFGVREAGHFLMLSTRIMYEHRTEMTRKFIAHPRHMPLVPGYCIRYKAPSVCNTHYQNGLRSEFQLHFFSLRICVFPVWCPQPTMIALQSVDSGEIFGQGMVKLNIVLT